MVGGMRAFLRTVLGVVAVVLVVVLVLWTVQRRLTYFPTGAPPPVEQVLPGGEAVELHTDDGLVLDAWWVAGGPTAVMVLHGNGGNRAGRAPLATALQELGLSVLLTDYRGYGGNPGRPSQAGLLADARAGAVWLADRDDVDDVVLFGESLGAAVALALARDHPPAAVVLRSPFTSLVDVARAHYGPVPGWLLRDHYPAVDWVGDLDAPLLVIAGGDDEIVPEASSRALFEAAGEPKRYVTIAGAGHNDMAMLDGPALLDAVRDFLGAHDLLPRRGRTDL